MPHFLFELLAKTNEGRQTSLDSVPLGRAQLAQLQFVLSGGA